MPDRSWTLLSSRPIADYPVLRLREDHYRFEPSGLEGNFVVCESRDWALVIPITSDGQIVLVRQYRHGVRQVVLEVPGGVLDAGETPAESAARELREETGFAATSIRLIGKMLPNPAINSAEVHVLVAEGCRKVGEPQLDPFERIEGRSAAAGGYPGHDRRRPDAARAGNRCAGVGENDVDGAMTCRAQPNLETSRLMLRPFRMADADEVQRLAGDRAVADTTLKIPHPYEDGMAEKWIANHRDWFDCGEQAVFAITRKDDGRLLGAVGLRIEPTTSGRNWLLDWKAVLGPGLLHRGGPGNG